MSSSGRAAATSSIDDDEFSVMEADIDAAKAEGADGVVIGLLNADGTIDVERTRALVARARPLAVTFHRAFDMTPDPFAALDTLIALGVERVLTSGQEASVLEGLPLIAELVRRAGEKIIVMPGGGITARNVERIVARCGRAKSTSPRWKPRRAACASAASMCSWAANCARRNSPAPSPRWTRSAA